MATAERSARARVPALVLVPVVIAATVFWFAARRPGPATAVAHEPLAVEATSTLHFEDLGELTRASDLVVFASVSATERGRLVGDPHHGGVISRFVTLRVERVLADQGGPRPTTLLVEEEGWLGDGTPIIVNGLAPSTTGDRGLWFLDEVATDAAPIFIVINEQGRYLQTEGPQPTTVGAQRRDALIQRLEAVPLDQLAALVLELAR